MILHFSLCSVVYTTLPEGTDVDNGKNENINLPEDEVEVNVMPTIELVEYERAAYVKEMEEYLQKLKSMPNAEARKKSRINLENSHIIQKNGEFSERYSYSRKRNADL